MAELAIAALVVGTATAATGAVVAGTQQSRAAAFQQDQLRLQAEANRTAAAQEEAKRRADLTSSMETIAAIRAGRGVGGGSPSGNAFLDNLITRSEGDIATAKTNLLTKADVASRGATLAGQASDASLLGGYLTAATDIGTAAFKGYAGAGGKGYS